MRYAIYDVATGRIEKICDCPESDIHLNVGQGQHYYEGDAQDDKHYIQNGKLVDIPEQPHDLAVFNWKTKQWDMPSEDELYAKAAYEIRSMRRDYLMDTDWTQSLDVPETLRQLYQPYRQALRDITNQPGFPYTVTWPIKPE